MRWTSHKSKQQFRTCISNNHGSWCNNHGSKVGVSWCLPKENGDPTRHTNPYKSTYIYIYLFKKQHESMPSICNQSTSSIFFQPQPIHADQNLDQCDQSKSTNSSRMSPRSGVPPWEGTSMLDASAGAAWRDEAANHHGTDHEMMLIPLCLRRCLRPEFESVMSVYWNAP